MSNYFYSDLKKGHTGEHLVNYLMLSYNYLTDYNTSSTLYELKQYDISYTATTTPQKTGKIEVKTDFKFKNTGNIIIEFKYKNQPSGIATTRSNYYYIITHHQIIIIPTQQLKNLYNNHYQQLHIVNNYDYSTLSFLLSLSDLEIYKIPYSLVNYSIDFTSSSLSFNSKKSSSTITLSTTQIEEISKLFTSSN